MQALLLAFCLRHTLHHVGPRFALLGCLPVVRRLCGLLCGPVSGQACCRQGLLRRAMRVAGLLRRLVAFLQFALLLCVRLQLARQRRQGVVQARNIALRLLLALLHGLHLGPLRARLVQLGLPLRGRAGCGFLVCGCQQLGQLIDLLLVLGHAALLLGQLGGFVVQGFQHIGIGACWFARAPGQQGF